MLLLSPRWVQPPPAANDGIVSLRRPCLPEQSIKKEVKTDVSLTRCRAAAICACADRNRSKFRTAFAYRCTPVARSFANFSSQRTGLSCVKFSTVYRDTPSTRKAFQVVSPSLCVSVYCRGASPIEVHGGPNVLSFVFLAKGSACSLHILIVRSDQAV